MTLRAKCRNRKAGFSLLELLVVVAILSIIMGTLFSNFDDVQRNNATEQVKLDLFQQSREFMDQISRDLRSAGYPNPHNASQAQFGGPLAGNDAAPDQVSSRIAVGLVFANYNELQFEGDVTGEGRVSVIRYLLDKSDPNNFRLKRSQTYKADGLAPNSQPNDNFEVEVEHVMNGTAPNDPIFTAYFPDGTVANKPDGTRLDLMTDAITMARVNSVKISLTVQAKDADPRTKVKPTTTLISTVKLNNCSAAIGVSKKDYFMSCY